MYNDPSDYTINIGTIVYSLWVDSIGVKIYLATDSGSKLVYWDGFNWVITIPSYFTTHIGSNSTVFITLLNN